MSEQSTDKATDKSLDLEGIIDNSIANEKPLTTFDPDCIRKRSNWSTVKNEFKFDHPEFSQEMFLKDMPDFSPKLVALLKKMGELDARDQKKYGKTFKHFIFSDIKSGGQGAKMIAAGLSASGWNMATNAEWLNREAYTEALRKYDRGDKKIPEPKYGPLTLLSQRELFATRKHNFLLLSSVGVFTKPISVQMKKSMLALFNSRPENIYGDLARVIVMDSGFKEGIDLFDIKYVHIFEPAMNAADQKQVIGRGTRTCGQKGLPFHPTQGWPLEVFVYDLEIPERLRFSLLGADTGQDLWLKAMNMDVRLANFEYDMERLAVVGSVDFELNKAVHNFQVDLLDDDTDSDRIVLGGSSEASISSEASSRSRSKDEFDVAMSFGHYQMVKYIRDNFSKFKWENVKMENLCGEVPKEWEDWEPKESVSSENISELTVEDSELPVLSSLSKSSASTPKLSSKSASKATPKLSSKSASKATTLSVSVFDSPKSKSDSQLTATLLDSPKSKSDSQLTTTLLDLPDNKSDSQLTTTLLDSLKNKSASKPSEATTESVRRSEATTESASLARSKRGGASSVLNFTPTQAFVQQYFTPFAPVKGMLLYHSVGTGKCHAKDTPILMYDGSIKMVQDIQVGELLMGDNSTPRKVLSLASGEDDMYDIIPTKGEKYTVNSEHILCLQSTKLGITYIKSQSQSPYAVRYINMKTKSIISKSFPTRKEAEEFQEYVSQDNIMEIEVKDYLKLSKNIQRNLKGYRTAVKFESKEVSLDPYLLGYWLGDGSQRGPVISSQDAIVLKYMRDYAIENDLTFNYQSQYDYRFSGSRQKGNKVLKDLQYYQLINNKHIPLEYKANDRVIRLQLLAGLIDSDGYCDVKGRCYEITQKNKVLAEDIVYLCRSLGFAAYMKECQKYCMYKGENKTGTYWRTCISGAGLEEIPVKIIRKKQQERTINKNALVTGITVESVGRGGYYGFTLDGNNRYVLGDFTVTHNTCSAIAAATSNFEPFGYTILWVTRTTLKNDIWKNMFDQVCHKDIQERINQGENIPDVQKERMRLLSKAWRIRPMSYKQFSNLVSKKNRYYEQLVKENGEADPLQRTLLIIDEAHKLYGGTDLSSLERPDMSALHQALMNSYAISGENSVRLLLMTATPITKHPLELVQLVNLCRPIEKQIPATFDQFAAEYLTEEGTFTSFGQDRFLDQIAGHISYLNREKDARQFSQPRIKRVLVPILSESQMPHVDDFDKFVARSQAETDILAIQDRLEKTATKIENELRDISKEDFDSFFELCEKYENISEKKCKIVIKKNVVALVKEVKAYTKSLREQLKTIRKELGEMKKGKQLKIAVIAKKIKENPTLFSQYNASTYAAIRSKCSSKTLKGTQFLDAVEALPEVVELNHKIQANKEAIAMMETQLETELVYYKQKVKQLKESLKKPDIAPIEKTTIEYMIRKFKTGFRTAKKNRTKEVQEEVKRITSKIQTSEKAKRELFQTIRKTLKKRERDAKKEEKKAIKVERALKKTLKVQKDIQDEDVKQMAERRKGLIEYDLAELQKETRENEREKEKQKQEKEEEREHVRREKERAKTLKQREKLEEKERNNLEKERAKTLKQREKQEEKERAKTLKQREKQEQKEQKKREKNKKK